MKLYEFYPEDLQYIKQIVDLEEKSSQDDSTFIQDCLTQVKNRNKLTWNLFKKLIKYFSTIHIETIKDIIQEIVEQDRQRLPSFFIRKFQKYVKSSLTPFVEENRKKIIINICQLLIRNKYSIDFNDIQANIEDLLPIDGDKNEEKITKIESLAQIDQHAQNTIEITEDKIINEKCSILKNSKYYSICRKQALTTLIFITNLFQSLINYVSYLRTINILPNYFQINWDRFTESIFYEEDITIQDVFNFVYKIMERIHSSPQISVITRQFHKTGQVTVNLLNEKFRSGLQQGKESCRYVSNLAMKTFENQILPNSIKFFKRCTTYWDNKDLIKVESLLTDDEKILEELSKNIQERNVIITQDLIISFIDILVISKQNKEQNLNHQITVMLFEIYLYQGLPNNIIDYLSQKIIQHPELVQFPYLVWIIAISLKNNRNIPDLVIEKLWKQFLLLPEDSSDNTKTQLKKSLIYTITILVTENQQLSMDKLVKLAKLLKNSQGIKMRITIAKILSKQMKFINEQVVVELLKDVALQPQNNSNEDLLNKIIFHSLKEYIDDEFLNNFYRKFKTRVLTIDKTKDLQKLDKFIEEEQTLRKFQLLNLLNIQLSDSQQINTTIFTEFTRNEWIKEILANQLITNIFKIKQNYDEGINESEFKTFIKYIQLLTKQIIYPIEDLLELLIIKQNIYKFNLEIVNDILFMLASQKSFDEEEKKKIFDILHNDYQDFYIQLRSIWLDKLLKSFKIQFTYDSFTKLNEYLSHKPNIINFVFNQIDQSTKTIEEFIEFFRILTNSDLTYEDQQTFLENELVEKLTFKNLLIKLNTELIALILSKKFSFYQDYFKSKKHYNLSTNIQLKKNAYNQANTTESYTAKDITHISSQLMKQFTNRNLRILQAFDQQDNNSLATILNKVIDEYKQENNTIFIIPLNIADSHWITIAIVPFENRNILLYKDSLGEENRIEERKEIEEIFHRATLPNFEFHYNRSCEQVDNYNGGIFTLENMKIMAEKLTASTKQINRFINKFQNWKEFVHKKKVVHLRTEIFPQNYALNLCESFKKRKIIDHHSSELKHLEDLLRKEKIIENNIEYFITTIEENFNEKNNQICLSIALPQEENFVENYYQYLYVIKIHTEINSIDEDLTKLKRKLMEILDIHEIYEQDKKFMKILDKNLTKLTQKNTKLHLDELKIEKLLSSDKEIEELLGQIDVEITELNKHILRENLGLIKKNSVAISSNENKDEIVGIKHGELLYKFHQKLIKILTSAGWLFESIGKLISFVDSKLKLEHLLHSLDPIYEYNLKECDRNLEGKNVLEILMTISSEKWITEIHNLAIFQTFKGSHIKDLDELKEEIFAEELDKEFLFNEYKEIEEFYGKNSKICPQFDIIGNWMEDQIKQWAKQLKLNQNMINRYEMIAVIKRTIEITSKFTPEKIQLLALIILLNPNENKHGRLAQINTGEGKTIIVAMLAAVKALEGHQVDIVTSSPELAKPQSQDQKQFFKFLGLTCEHNGQDSTIKIEERYQADIIYGSANDFQADILRDECSKSGIRQGRKCDVAIVDEVDSMLIDGKNNIVMLSSSMPGMDHLEPLLAAIWIQIGEVAKSIKEINGKLYVIDPQNYLDEHGKFRSDIVDYAYPVKGTKGDFIRVCTEKHIRKLIRDESLLEEDKKDLDKYPKINIPKHLRDLVIKTQLKKWISYAIYAKYECKINQDYILHDRKIILVDARNTGVLQHNMIWNDGLHQFLQIKHGTKIIPENFTTNFISNVTYFKRYSPHIFGLTGTLGSNKARHLLNETYNVDSVIIPPYKQKQYKELTPIICHCEDDWYMNIVESSMNKLKNGRAVLIITKYIEEVEEIKKRLTIEKYDEDKIKMYKTEADAMTAVRQGLKHGEIIIATNIAGRGTDIHASKTIENNGGLHVCVTFLPINERVEQQNVGRTSRKGNKGTGQFIVFITNSNDDFEQLKKQRDDEEKRELQYAKKQMDEVLIKDEIFESFRKLLDNVNDNDCLLEKFSKDPISKIKLRAVEERFAIWLKMEDQIEKNDMKTKFKEFEKQILLNKQNNKLIQNPYFHILIGNEFLEMNISEKYTRAIEEFTKAIELDKDFPIPNAYYNRGYARLAQYKDDIHHEQITEAINDFTKARKIIEDIFEPSLNIIQQASTNSEVLSEQVAHKMTLYGIQKNTIEIAIGQDITSQIEELNKEKQERRDATGRRGKEIEQQLENLKKEKPPQFQRIAELEKEKEDQHKIMIKNEEIIDKEIEALKKIQEVKKLGVIRQARKSNQSIEIEHIDIAKSLPENEDIKLYQEEIEEYINNGFMGNFMIKELKPIDWTAVLSVSALGLAQLIAGAAITVFSLGSGITVGMGLMVEGVSDLIIAVKDGIINRDFSWVTYGIQKAISLTVSLVCAGMGAIKDAAKTAAAGIGQVASMMSKTAMTTVTQTGWKIAAKAIGTSIAKGVAKELVTQLVDYGVNKAFIPIIEEKLMEQVEKPIQDALMKNDHVKKMLELDGINRNKKYEMLIKNKAFALLNPQQQHGKKHALIQIAEGIVSGIAMQKVHGLSTIMQANDVLQALNILEDFVKTFLETLDQIIKDIFENENVEKLWNESKQKTNTTTTTVNDGQQRDKDKSTENNSIIKPSIDDGKKTVPDKKGDIDTNQSNKQEEQAKLPSENKSSVELCQLLATSVSANMCNIIKCKIITPITRVGINYGMQQLTMELEQSLTKEIGLYKAERRVGFFQDNDKNNRIPEEHKQGEKDSEAIAKADEMIHDLENGGEAGLYHLGPLSNVTGRPIKVLNEKGEVVRIIGEDKGGEPIVVEYHEPSNGNSEGHWTLPGGREPSFGNTGKNNCLFNVIAEQTRKDPNQLRTDTVTYMESNKTNLANQASDIQQLKQCKKSALTMGGVEKRVVLKSSEIRFSQKGISKQTREGVNLEEIAKDMEIHGFDPNKPALVVVEMSDGKYTSMDNRRLAAASAHDIPVIADIYEHDEILPPKLQRRFRAKKAEDAVLKRMEQRRDSQKYRYSPEEVSIRGVKDTSTPPKNITVADFIKNKGKFPESPNNL